MGTYFHAARLCLPELVVELGAAAEAAVAEQNPGTLRSFLARYGARHRLVDGFRVPLDRTEIERARRAVEQTEQSAQRPELVLLLADLHEISLTEVSKTAQDALLGRLERIVRLLEIGAPEEVITMDVAWARIATGALASDDVSARLEQAQRNAEAEYGYDDEGELLWSALQLCLVPGRDHDVGIGLVPTGDAFLYTELVERPSIGLADDPPAALFERCITRFGAYQAELAWELFGEDWRRFVGRWDYSAPSWAAGAELVEVAARVRGAASSTHAEQDDDSSDPRLEDEQRRAFHAYADVLLAAHDAGYAVVEWVDKQ